MHDELDDRLRRLTDESDARLEGLETALIRRIALLARERRERTAFAKVQIAAATLSMVVGLAVGTSVASVPSHPFAPPEGAFASILRLAPSTLLERAPE